MMRSGSEILEEIFDVGPVALDRAVDRIEPGVLDDAARMLGELGHDRRPWLPAVSAHVRAAEMVDDEGELRDAIGDGQPVLEVPLGERDQLVDQALLSEKAQ